MRVVFMGTPSYATAILQSLYHDQEIDVVLVVTQEDKPVGRKQLLTPPDTKAWLISNELNIDVYQPKSLRIDGAREKIASYQPDFIVVAAYGQILPREILQIAPCINLHASLLPKFRGASPIQSMILANEPYVGVTSMLMEEGLDTGAILGLSYLRMESHYNSAILFERLAQLAGELTLRTLKHFDSLSPLPQTDANASLCKKIKKEDGLISFECSAEVLIQKFKAFTPWPGIFISSGLKLLDMEMVESYQTYPKSGSIQEVLEDGIILTCKKGSVLIKTLQPASKNAMKALDYIRGKRLACGDSLV